MDSEVPLKNASVRALQGRFVRSKGGIAILLASLLTCASFADGNVWWVDDDNYGKSGLDGTSAEKAFGTIQDAIDNADCTDGDTIKVMPGTYDQGYSGPDGDRRRVFVNKRLTIEATGSKDETHIVGRFCPVEEGGDSNYSGTGPTAVRCVFVNSAGIGSYLKGFTLRNGATKIEAGSGVSKNNGGAVAINVNDILSQFYVVDCVISNCVARGRGGAAVGGTFVRCLISDCRAQRDMAFMSSSAINCVISRCRAVFGSYHTLAYSNCKFANCTFYGNTDAQLETDNYRNCLFVGNGYTETTSNGAVGSNIYATQGKAYSNAKPIQLFAPAIGDFHPLQDSDVFGAGETRYLTTECPVSLPEGMELRDMDGELIDLTKETCSVGAYQSAKIPEYGGLLLPEDMTINGFPTYGSNLLFATSWPLSVKVSQANSAAFNFGVTGEAGEARVRCSGKDRYACITPPYKAGAIATNEFVKTLNSSTLNKRYVDAVNGSDENDGTSASPYATIQKAIDSNSSSRLLYVYVSEGDYSVGGAVDRGVTNRVHIGYMAGMHIVATGDRDKTIIRGAAARNERNHAQYPGCGPDAVRCVSYSFSGAVYDSTVAFIGFTFADGHTDVGQDADCDMGGAAFGRPEKRTTLQFVDCVFTNCYAPAAGVGVQAMFTRCRFIDCGGAEDGFRNSVLSSSIVESGNSFGTGVLGANTCSVGCSIAGPHAFVTGCTGQMALNTAAGEDGVLPDSAVTFGSTAISCFANAANGDFRPVSGSPALDASQRQFPSPGDSDWNAFATAFSDFAADGIDGSGWLYSGAYPIAGACMEWVGGVSLVMADASGYSITGGKAGGNVMSPGDSLTIARSPTAARKWGIVVNGVTNTLGKGSYVYAYDGTGGMNDGAIYPVRLPMGICISFR